MNILYVSTLCSDVRFKKIFENSEIKPQQQSQKFHDLLSKGAAKSVKSVHVMSRPPINPTTNRSLKLLNNIEVNENITYQYLKIFYNPIFRHIHIFITGFINTLKWIFKNRGEERIIVCDILNLSISLSALFASKITGVKNVAIVTDIPSYMRNYNSGKRSFFKKITSSIYTKLSQYFVKKYDVYTILTYQMNDFINPNKKPYLVIEGMVDFNMCKVSNSLYDKYKEQIIMYAGSLKEKAGIRKLIEAFIMLNNDNARLWLYGSGEMEDDIKEYEKRDNRIKYFGVVPNDTIVKEQLKVTLLVNPRPSDEEFTKYSFPSKNMEYMVSGTPILTTPLPGMPKEYYEYVLLFHDESTEGMTKTLDDILKSDEKDLHKKGKLAKSFVLENKNNIIQANKIINLTTKKEYLI
ncbi:glycosyltransferase [Haloplasma contractile]|uniref:Glycosyl transferase protein n=1 Tax=Haloplasma contractile SSD-17B TaxID=1033810 RepID=U2DQQ9_9MOLU|nr:glycosyltransferase [Haloplasma contractile]ERJ10937.1 Glycosyl transferase protein [Haloplasma contractile SSD-17B]